ncbi:hypothetical protein [Sphingomonas sp. LT1P40]|uniref:hypothetical protein n=1 Tax=Alteristakelama amylovorans TaxID=3096166 RepID=UPI002FCA7F80
MDLLTYLAKEWNVISQALFTFLIAGAMVAGLAYLAARSRFTGIVETLKERLSLKDDRIGDLERKLGELHEAAESPPPTVETHGAETEDYRVVIRQLTQRYVFNHDGISPGILAGAELPPREWMNIELKQMGKDWRIGDVQGASAEIVPLILPGPPPAGPQF